ncbi:MAG: arginine deiminase family protein [Candidatus Aminicenantes bacterium]|jgi:N-dimethylarginine dimethylaminohydrolase
MKIGCPSEVGEIEILLLKHPREAFVNQKNVDDQWKNLNYADRPDFEIAVEEYESFVELLRKFVTEIHYLPQNQNTGLDSVYVHDPMIITEGGAILCRMGKKARLGEPLALGEFLKTLEIPILGEIKEPGKLEGGDVIQFDERTLAVGQGYRSNAEGIRQLKELTKDFTEELTVVPLPHWDGPDDVLHLMSFISPVDRNSALVYSRLMPVPFREWLLQRGMTLIEVPDVEYESMACNVLAVSPGICIMLGGNLRTKHLLEQAGLEVWEYSGDEISRKGAGGPTCLTRPLYRKD